MQITKKKAMSCKITPLLFILIYLLHNILKNKKKIYVQEADGCSSILMLLNVIVSYLFIYKSKTECKL